MSVRAVNPSESPDNPQEVSDLKEDEKANAANIQELANSAELHAETLEQHGKRLGALEKRVDEMAASNLPRGVSAAGESYEQATEKYKLAQQEYARAQNAELMRLRKKQVECAIF
jgi:hypothetical protein